MAGPYPNDQGKAGGAIPVYMTGGPGGAAAPASITPVTDGSMTSALLAKASPGVSYGATAAVPSGNAASWLVGYNAATIPADGAVNPALVLQAVPIPAGPNFGSFNDAVPVAYSIGIVYYLTSGANPYANKVTTSMTGFISAKVV